ncbi:hypothetical protein BH18THE2_BH18THE2_39280 [soil metagenome]
MPDGTIGRAEVRLGDSVIMVSDAQGEEYKPMTNGIHLYVEYCYAIYINALWKRERHLLWNQRINFTMIEVQV